MCVGFERKPAIVHRGVCWSLVVAWCAGVTGCATTSGLSGRVNGSRSDGAQLAMGVDPERAFLSLSEIVPDAAPPPSNIDLPPLSERAAAQLARARSLVAEQRFTEATIALDRALRFDPKHPAVHAALASLH